MELKEDISYDQLLLAIKNLPEDKITQLKADLNAIKAKPKSLTAFQQLLLSGPVMNDDQYQDFKENRNHFNKWRTK